ncbi:hypothetical protein C2S52_018832 [Perilla frutescens var. hirtella]|nr:hypothetical protein C2S52_018832 [Perilla frutescens var. hirtella]
MAAYAALASLSKTTDLNRNLDKFRFSFSAEEKIRSIHEYVNFLLLFLDDFPEKANHWESEIRDLAHKIEDIVEHFMWQQTRSSYVPMKPSSVKLEDQLKGLTEEIGLIVGEMMEERPSDHLQAAVSSSPVRPATTVNNDAVIGLDDDVMAIKELLCGQSSHLQVIPIVGMGGIGKTTLARTVYDDRVILEYFEIRAWLTVSQNYSFRNILLSLAGSMKLLEKQWFGGRIGEEQVSGDQIDESEIAVKVFQNLKSRRYLVVMDDVWGADVLDRVRNVLPDDDNGSRIMLTTRLLDLATYPDFGSPIHEMRFMDSNQSWNLLRQKVFTHSSCPPELEDVGKEIARRCAGLPLTVVLVSGVLSTANTTRASWEEIAQTVNPVVEGELEEILAFSYSHLPHHLRPCFLFIGGFPEDENIQASRLIKLWVAEGFLLNHQKECSVKSLEEEEAERYLEDLVKRNLVLVTSRKSNGKIKSCGLHDAVRDMCVRKSHEEKFLRVLDRCVVPCGTMNERRISFSRRDTNDIWGPTIRTILCFQLQSFTNWLAFLGTSTLLKQLRHVVLYDLHMLPPPPDGSNLPLENLQTLSPVVNLLWNDKMVQMIPNVKKMGLVYSSNEEYHLHHLNDLLQLEKLEVTGYHCFSWSGQNPSFPKTLRKLSLVGGGFPWEYMRIIGSLPNLQVLKLLNHACEGETWETTDEEFPQLKFLLIDTSRLRQWITLSSPFPRLECLVLRSCRYLREIPEDIGEIPTLELIEVYNCAKPLGKSAKKIKEEQESCGNDALHVRVAHSDEEIQSHYKGMNPSCVKFEDQLKNVREKIGLIAGEMYPPIAISPSRIVPTVKDAVIDVHDDLKAIKDRLCGLSSELRVIPIVGMGGIGKTTLARTVYDDPLIMRHFQIRAWVKVSQDYSPQEIILHLVHSMTLLEKIDTSEMAEKVYKNLQCRRYLIVMDDIWNTDVWDDVRNVFPDDSNGSRIMLVTRNLDVAAYPDPNSPLHEIRVMDDHQSWGLLKERVFSNNSCPPELEDVGKEIARRCAGLPLAVVLVAGVLSATNHTRASWEEIARKVNLVVDGGLEEILSFSYTKLPYHLRSCFLFIGGFPEIANICASTFIKLWVAEGVMLGHQDGCSKSLEDEAEGYLEDLVKRNLVIAFSRTSNGRIKSCGLHDLVRDMCIRKAEEEKFRQGLMNEQRISFSVFSDTDSIWGPAIHRLLRALDDRHKELQYSQVFEQFSLRYLALNASSNIPSAISNLSNLQTLIIHPTFGLQKRHRRYDENASHFSLPVEIWKMRQLRHVILYDLYTLPNPPDGSDLHLQNLQTLWHVKDLVWNEKIVQMIPNVKRLGLVYTNINQDNYLHHFRSLNEMNEKYHLHHLKHLHQLEKLRVIGSYRFSWRGNNPSFPWTLKKLSLVGGGYPWEDMGIIGSLPNLQVLKLLDHACDGQTWETADEEFPQLKLLLIDTSRLRHWETQSSHFPRLERLVLRFCLVLKEIPRGIGEIPTLELIEVDHCRKSLVESAKEMNKDQESNENYTLQVRTNFNEMREELDEQPSIEEMQFVHVQRNRESRVMDVATGKETAEIHGTIFHGIFEKMRVTCNRVVKRVLSTVNKTRVSWMKMAKNVNPVVELELEEILSLSYTHLPHHLRPCFLYFGGFLADAKIHASRLIKLWVAEGFLKQQNGCSKSLEEEAEENLKDLVKRNLVIVTSRKSNGKIKSCCLHDMVRDFCIRKAHEEKFLHVIDGRLLPQSMINERRISFSCSHLENICCPIIRTILCFQLHDFPSWLEFLGRFKLVRVLDVVGKRHKELPSQIFELFHLRYLALNGSFKIPSTISNLVNLQTLIIHPKFCLQKRHKRYGRKNNNASHFSLPLEIWRLQQLRHLVFFDLYMLPHPLDGPNLPLENLQTLLNVENLVWNEKILQMIPNVKRLGLVYTSNEEYHLHHLKHLHQLEKLEVNGCWGFSWLGKNPTFPSTLKKLIFVGGGFPWTDMGIIGSLPNLQVLKLLDHACDSETWETTDEEFPQLKFLLIEKSGLRQWITQSNHFPRLECLVLRFCADLMEIPKDIGEIPTLEMIELDVSSHSLVESAKQISEDQRSYGNYALQVRVKKPQQMTRTGEIQVPYLIAMNTFFIQFWVARLRYASLQVIERENMITNAYRLIAE